MGDWRPALQGGDAPAYARLAARLAADIDAGVLAPGERLPTQRALADQLGLGLGTVTRAYAEAETRGLIEAVVGRGSFVAAPRPLPTDGLVDLAQNLPPSGPARAAMRQAMARLLKRADLEERLGYAPPEGFEADRRAGAVWLRRTETYPEADPATLICCAGAQQGIALSIAALCRPGDSLIVEAATFHGVKLAAAHAGVGLVAAPMDAEGLTPEGLARAARESGARAAYVLPVQNPTARVMGEGRRRDIVDVAKKAGVVLIEDDLYGPHAAPLGLAPLAQLAPERVIYIAGLSKSLSPGLRSGYVIAPSALRPALLTALRSVAFGPPSFGALLGTHWIESGEAFDILGAVLAEIRRRCDLARTVLGAVVEPIRQRASSHLWLPLTELEAERVAGQALRAGVKVTPPDAPFVPGIPISGVRLCLGAAPDIATLERGLLVVREALSPLHRLAETVV